MAPAPPPATAPPSVAAAPYAAPNGRGRTDRRGPEATWPKPPPKNPPVVACRAMLPIGPGPRPPSRVSPAWNSEEDLNAPALNPALRPARDSRRIQLNCFRASCSRMLPIFFTLRMAVSVRSFSARITLFRVASSSRQATFLPASSLFWRDRMVMILRRSRAANRRARREPAVSTSSRRLASRRPALRFFTAF